MRALPADLRRQLESSVLAGRRAAETGVRAAFSALGVEDREKLSHLSEEQARLRRGLRAKQRQLGGEYDVLLWDAAYEQWHRLLFARFLAENNLLRHPEFGAPVTLAECEDLAEELGEPDGWSVAARFAAEILPGIFRLDDPCVQLRLAPEHRIALEKIVAGLLAEVFAADDSLGWVYQYWQSERKDQVNASEVKIGGADLGPVTQLFTENYMVRFLLENSLGAWWAARHPESPLVKEFEYLRFDDDGRPAAGRFDGWPDRATKVTVMDPCCGSGHFLVEAFGMLWRMRAEEEGVDPVAAQDAVLRDNLFGLELDPRCLQIAMFAIALTAWKQGGGWRDLPMPNIACSGIPAKAPLAEWTALAEGDERLEQALERLHTLFRDADTLGSLIDPRRATARMITTGMQRSLEDADFDKVAPLLEKAASRETADSATAVLGADATGIARAAALLSRAYTLVSTNVPYLGSQRMRPKAAEFLQSRFPSSSWDLSTVFLERTREMTAGGSIAVVVPIGWMFLRNYKDLREKLLRVASWNCLAVLGEGAFRAISGAVVKTALLILSAKDRSDHNLTAIDVSGLAGAEEKSGGLRSESLQVVSQEALRANPDEILAFGQTSGRRLEEYATSWQGLVTGDNNRYMVRFWEVPAPSSTWERYLTAPRTTAPFTSRSHYLRWEKGAGALIRDSGAHNFNPPEVRASAGVLVGQSTLAATLYRGEMFNDAAAPIIPTLPENLPALWEFLKSDEYATSVRRINRTVKVGVGYLVKVPFDLDRWRRVAEGHDSLPEQWSNDPTQWLFEGRLEGATEPLQVGPSRLVGYQWPEQPPSDGHEGFCDDDGIVCLPAVAGEEQAATRLNALLARAYGNNWSPGLLRQLVEQTGSKKKNLADWLRDDFFGHHCSVFASRPFVWHIWDGRKDGFSALANYHRLDRAGLEKLTYTYLGDWIERQRADAADDVAGADIRLAAALELKGKLEAILKGEPPYDIYVRWKALHEQPIGWEPDLDDGVRLNIRPFVKAGVLRSKVNVHWRKDRGKNPDGSERLNDLHLAIAEKQEARRKVMV